MGFENDQGEFVDIEIDHKRSVVSLDRSQSGKVGFNEQFSSVQEGTLTTINTQYSVSIVIDRSSLELFIDDGTTVMTSLIFPASVYDTMSVKTDSQPLKQVSVERLGSIWSAK